MKKPLVGAAVFVGGVVLLIGFIWWAAAKGERDNRERDRQLLEGPCRDESTLLATTSGSPSYFSCPNRLHEMQVQVATHPSSEEAAALVFCKCRREGSP